MARSKDMQIFLSYARAKKPDAQLFAELTQKAIGPNRTLTRFADDCDLSPSTLSRIINCQFKSPSSDKVIQAIAANADPESGVTAELLLNAQGRVPIQFAEVTVNNHHPLVKTVVPPILKQRPGSTGLYSDIAQEIIQSALLKKGYRISIVDNNNIVTIPGLQYHSDFVIEIHKGSERLGFNKWAFDVHMDGVRPIMHKISWIFGTAYLDSFRNRKTKVSLIVDNKTEFHEVKQLLQHVQIHDLVSIILIDTCNRQLVEEFQIPTKDQLRTAVMITD